jgi:hypothetical protein
MKTIKAAVRAASGADNALVGVKPVRAAFPPHHNGKAGTWLTGGEAEGGERGRGLHHGSEFALDRHAGRQLLS